MSLEVVVPEVSEGVTEGTVTSPLPWQWVIWFEADQTLLELETDKAVVAIPSPSAGKVKEIRVAEGEQAKVGAVIVILDEVEAAERQKPAAPQESAEEKTAESSTPVCGNEGSARSAKRPRGWAGRCRAGCCRCRSRRLCSGLQGG